VFSVEIEFRDGISHPETVLVRRTSAVIGASDRAHVVIDGAGSGVADIQVLRGIGRSFSCFNISRSANTSSEEQKIIEGTHSNSVDLKYGNLSLLITALDIDLMLAQEESPDKGAVRILKRALNSKSAIYPAVAVVGSRPLYVSFVEGVPISIGRNRGSGLRLEASDISGEHARIGCDDGAFWVEDLGSTNGTFVDDLKISGRRILENSEKVRVGADTTLVPIKSQEDVQNLQAYVKQSNNEDLVVSRISYPCLISSSENIRPKSLFLEQNSTITIGRDPANDVWISASHISREHLQISRDAANGVVITDLSSNGSFLEGDRLVMGEATRVEKGPVNIDLCSGVELVLYLHKDENSEASKILEILDIEEESQNLDEKIFNDKLNEANFQQKTASDYFETPYSEKQKPVESVEGLSEFEKYQRTQSQNPVFGDNFEKGDILEDDENYLLNNQSKDMRSLFLLVLFMLLVAVLCVVIFTS